MSAMVTPSTSRRSSRPSNVRDRGKDILLPPAIFLDKSLYCDFRSDKIMFLQQLVTGISVGGIYALLATGYSLIYSLLDFSNWAHGEFAMVSAYVAIVLSNIMGMPFVLGRHRRHDGRRAGELSVRAPCLSPYPPQRRPQYVPDDRRHGPFQYVPAGGQPDLLRSVPGPIPSSCRSPPFRWRPPTSVCWIL